MLGWNLNAVVFVINLFVVFGAVKTNDPSSLHKQSEMLKELKQEFDKLYPNRKYDLFISYFLPFAALFRTSFRLFEMSMFFRANPDTKMYDFMVYKYQAEINRVKQ
jgi:hypothetical protein